MAKALWTFKRLTGRGATWAQREAMLRLVNDGWDAADAAQFVSECE